MTQSTRFNAKDICEMALEDIGVISVNERGAKKEYLRRALARLDLIVAFVAGTNRCFWLIPDTIEIPLTATVKDYNLITTLGVDAPAGGIQFPVAARIRDPYGKISPVTIVTLETWNAIDDPSRSGTPELAYIDRLEEPTLSTWPTLGDTTDGWTILLDIQTYGPSFTGVREERASHNLRLAWQLYAVTALAAYLGNGPVRKLPASDIRTRELRADGYLDKLLAFENRQHDTEAPIVESNEDFTPPGSGMSIWG